MNTKYAWPASRHRERKEKLDVHPTSKRKNTEMDFPEPEATVACFFNSLFGHTRNWPRAYACMTRKAREKFDSERGLPSFADYWEDKLSFLEELVKQRHTELPYKHRTCFSLDHIQQEDISADRAVVSVELVENHLAPERLKVVQRKELSKHGQNWLLTSGELEGNMDEIILVMSARSRRLGLRNR